jgi:hypothetical protein
LRIVVFDTNKLKKQKMTHYDKRFIHIWKAMKTNTLSGQNIS